MRDYYPSCNLHLNNSVAGDFFYRSLRYSTHCNYRILTTEVRPNWYEDFPYHSIVNDYMAKPENDFELYFEGSCFSINTSIVEDKLEIFVENNDENELSAISKIIKIDYLVDYEKSCVFLGAVDDDEVTINRSWELQKLADAMKEVVSRKIEFKPHSILSFHCSLRANHLVCSKCYINKFSERFELYRAYGINVPLMLIQSLLNRKVGVTVMVNSSSIHVVDKQIKYAFSPSSYVFDLDETLICKGLPIKEMVSLVKRLKYLGCKIELLTRHIHDISKTLESIGLDSQDFDKIQKVEKHEKKSSFISDDAVFIDNEFPQRKDVREVAGSNVLDLDQIDFLSL